jgi:hypothetical protein
MLSITKESERKMKNKVFDFGDYLTSEGKIISKKKKIKLVTYYCAVSWLNETPEFNFRYATPFFSVKKEAILAGKRLFKGDHKIVTVKFRE